MQFTIGEGKGEMINHFSTFQVLPMDYSVIISLCKTMKILLVSLTRLI